MAGDIEMELMVVVLVVISTTTIPSPCQSLKARANNILQFFGKDNLGFRHQSLPTKWFLQPPPECGEWKEEI